MSLSTSVVLGSNQGARFGASERSDQVPVKMMGEYHRN